MLANQYRHLSSVYREGIEPEACCARSYSGPLLKGTRSRLDVERPLSEAVEQNVCIHYRVT